MHMESVDFQFVSRIFSFIHIPVKYPVRLSWVESLPNSSSPGGQGKNILAGKI